MSKSFRSLLIVSAGFSVMLAYQNFTPSNVVKPIQSQGATPGVIYHNGTQLVLENRKPEIEKEIVMSVNNSYKRKIDYQTELNKAFESACADIKVGSGNFNGLVVDSKFKAISANLTHNSSLLVNQKDDNSNYSHYKYKIRCHHKKPINSIEENYPKFRSPRDNKATLIFFPQVILLEHNYMTVIERKIGFKIQRGPIALNLNEKSKEVIAAANEACKSITHSVGYNEILAQRYGYRDVSMNLYALEISKPKVNFESFFIEKTFKIKCGNYSLKDNEDFK